MPEVRTEYRVLSTGILRSEVQPGSSLGRSLVDTQSLSIRPSISTSESDDTGGRIPRSWHYLAPRKFRYILQYDQIFWSGTEMAGMK